MTQFSSKDFGKTPSKMTAKLPAKLIHKQVEKTNVDTQFSAERKHPVSVVDLPSITLSMTLGGIVPGGRTGKHRHSYETVIYVLEGKGFTMVEDQRVEWEAGDALYVPVWAWHHHVNLSASESCRYLACENAPLLQNLGGVAIREEE